MSDVDPTLPQTRGADATPASGARIGRFATLGTLGTGGMGVVLEAHDPELNRRVAIKLLHAGHEAVYLQREAQAMAKLSHPNVVAVYEVGRFDEQTFIAMELVEGQTLRAWMGAPRPWRQTVETLLGAGRGLAAAHEAGMVHRDVKPENILIGNDGRARVTDFGLGSDVFPEDGTAAGTPAYMSPEHWAGKQLDARSDQFSFCVTLWEALWKQRPFHGDPHELREAVGAGVMVAPPAEPAIPRWLEAALRRGLSPDPSERWPGLTPLLDALEERLRRRRRLPWILAGVALAAAAALAVVLVLGGRDRRALAPPPPPGPSFALVADSVVRLTFDDGCEEAPALAPDGRTVYYDATVGGALHLFAVDVAGGVPRELTHTDGWDLAPEVSPDGRRLAFLRSTADMNLSLAVAPLGELDRPKMFGVAGTRPFWSPDGARVWSGWTDQLVAYDAATGAPRRTLTPPEGRIAGQGIELPDGRVVILTVPLDGSALADRVLVYPAPGPAGEGPPVQLFEGSMWDVLALLPEGDAVVVAKRNQNHTIDLWRVPLDGSRPGVLEQGTILARNHLSIVGRRVVWSDCFARTTLATLGAAGSVDLGRSDWADISPVGVPGTQEYYFVSDRTAQFTIFRGDRTRPGSVTPLPLGDYSPGQLAVSVDGRMLAFVDRHHGLLVAPSDGSSAPRLLAPDTDDVAPSFDRHGTAVYFSRVDGETAHLMWVPVAGGVATRMLTGISAPTASPTDDVLAYLVPATTGSGTELMLLDLQGGESRRVLPEGAETDFWDALRWSPDGKRLLLVRSSGAVTEVEVATGRVLRHLDVAPDILDGVTYVGDELVVARARWSGDLWTATLRD